MTRWRDGLAPTHIRDLMGWVAVAAVLIYPAAVLKDELLCLYLSGLALVLPWVALCWVRAVNGPGPYRDWVATPVLFCAPLAMISGLDRFAGTLGLDPGYQHVSFLPAYSVAAFAVGFVGPWLLASAVWDLWQYRPNPRRPKRLGIPGSPIARLMAMVAVVAIGLAACLSPVIFVETVFFLNVGHFVAFVIRQHQAQKPQGRGSNRWPSEVGYVPRADGDDPFA